MATTAHGPTTPTPPYSDDLGDAGGSYARSARKLIDDVGERVGNVTTRIARGFQGDGVWDDEQQ